jgi:hypothetical protein
LGGENNQILIKPKFITYKVSVSGLLRLIIIDTRGGGAHSLTHNAKKEKMKIVSFHGARDEIFPPFICHTQSRLNSTSDVCSVHHFRHSCESSFMA